MIWLSNIQTRFIPQCLNEKHKLFCMFETAQKQTVFLPTHIIIFILTIQTWLGVLHFFIYHTKYSWKITSLSYICNKMILLKLFYRGVESNVWLFRRWIWYIFSLPFRQLQFSVWWFISIKNQHWQNTLKQD